MTGDLFYICNFWHENSQQKQPVAARLILGENIVRIEVSFFEILYHSWSDDRISVAFYSYIMF